jgi:hypothetical protein
MIVNECYETAGRRKKAPEIGDFRRKNGPNAPSRTSPLITFAHLAKGCAAEPTIIALGGISGTNHKPFA